MPNQTKPEPKRSDYPSDDDGLIAYARDHKKWKRANDARRAREENRKAKDREDALIARFLAADAEKRAVVLELAKRWRDENGVKSVKKSAGETQASSAVGSPKRDETGVRVDAQPHSVDAQNRSVSSGLGVSGGAAHPSI